MESSSSRWRARDQRAVRIANCSGARGDPGYQMKRQIELGDVDFITGDYLAGSDGSCTAMNMAEHAEAYRQGRHPGYEPFALQGLQESLKLIAQKGVKVIINGGSLNPAGLASECRNLASKWHLDLKIAYVSGDDLYEHIKTGINAKNAVPDHLDTDNPKVTLDSAVEQFAQNPSASAIVSANAYLGARAIVKGLENGADIIICGRVADASPVIGAAWFWHSWSERDYDCLAQALVAGHLIECSAYVTGANFSAFYEVDLERLIDLPFPIVEIDSRGSAIVCKHNNTRGLVTEDTVKNQFLYELQGNLYLNSDVTAILDDVKIETVGADRVQVTGVRGQPPSPTTKLAIFFRGGYQSQLLVNATGYATAEKWTLYEAQILSGLRKLDVIDSFSALEFQVVGINEPNPASQLRSTTYCRVFAQAKSEETLRALLKVVGEFGMQHFSVPQEELKEAVHFLSEDGAIESSIDAGHPPQYQALSTRDNYETASPVDLESFGSTAKARLGDIVLARSGDKGANLNIGLFVREAATWPWFRTFMTAKQIKVLMGEDWCQDFHVERVEFQNLYAVHFVIYGVLGKGVSSSTRLDSLGKGFADFIRDRVVDIPRSLLKSATARQENL
ncbi:hypothetical protein ACJ41O_015006 [Fusarium nematophilum]